jgi:membrane-associated phospholipid phosphatase
METSYIQMLPMENLQSVPGIYLWGIEIIRAIQKIQSPVLTAVISFITELGTDNFYIPVIMFIFWWIDEKKGLRLGILVILSGWINVFFKDILKQPRPYNFDPALGLAYEPTYGAPSGHAQNSLCFWVSIAAWIAGRKKSQKRFLVWAAAALFILLIGFTRLYLGVHFPTDLFAGWILGALILFLMYILSPLLIKHLSGQTRLLNIFTAFAALAMITLYPNDRYLPALLLGFCLGYTIMKKNFPFCTQSEIKEKKLLILCLRCLTGFAGFAVIYLVLRLLLPGEGSLFSYIPVWGKSSPFYELGRFIRYGLIGLWASAGAPMVFQRMGLSCAAKTEDSPPAKNQKDDES